MARRPSAFQQMWHIQRRHRVPLEKAIGRFIVAFNTLERALTTLIEFLIDSENPGKGAAVCASLSFDARLDLLSALSEVTKQPPAVANSISQIVAGADKHRARRNKLAHYHHAVVYPTATHLQIAFTVKGRKGLNMRTETWTPKQIFSFSNECLDLSQEAFDLVPKLTPVAKWFQLDQ